MSNEYVDSIVRELIELDPSLSEREADLHAILTFFITKKPDITIDSTFVATLRTRLITTKKPISSPYTKFNWWVLRLAPIGAVALLLLVLAPERIHHLDEQLMPVMETTPVDSDEFKNNSFTHDQDSVPQAKSAPESVENANADGNNMLRMNTMGGDTDYTPPPNRFEIGQQQPGVSVILKSVTLTQPGFVIIHTFNQDGVGPVVGVSPLLSGGTTAGVPIYLRGVTHRSEMYYVGLYRDNGNGVFSLSDDTPIIDPNYGVPYSTTFTVGVTGAL